METNRESVKFKSGTFFELPQNVGPIPKGVYRMGGCDLNSAEFYPGKKAVFSIFGNWQSKVRPVPPSRAWRIKTSQSDFIERYYELLNGIKGKNAHGEVSDVYTMCFLDPSICREMM